MNDGGDGCGCLIILVLLFVAYCVVMAVLALFGFHYWWMQ